MSVTFNAMWAFIFLDAKQDLCNSATLYVELSATLLVDCTVITLILQSNYTFQDNLVKKTPLRHGSRSEATFEDIFWKKSLVLRIQIQRLLTSKRYQTFLRGISLILKSLLRRYWRQGIYAGMFFFIFWDLKVIGELGSG